MNRTHVVTDKWRSQQLAVCKKHDVAPVGVSPDEK